MSLIRSYKVPVASSVVSGAGRGVGIDALDPDLTGHVELHALGRGGGEQRQVVLERFLERHLGPGLLGHVPPVLQQLMEDLGRLEPVEQLGRDRLHDRLEPEVEPAHGGDVLGDRSRRGSLQLGTESLDVVQHPSRLVLAGHEPGEAGEALGVVSVLDHLGHVSQAGAVVGGDDLHLLDVESELVQPIESGPHRGDVTDPGGRLGRQFGPQRLVAVLDGERDGDRIDPVGQATGGLEVEQPAGDVVGCDQQVELALAGRQLVVTLGGLDVDDVGLQRPGVTPEQRVRERAVTPEEAGEVDPHQQDDERVEQAVAEVRDRQAASHQQRPVGERVVEVPGDHQPFAGRSVGHHRDHLGRRQPVVGDRPQQAVLAVGQLVGQLLDDVRHAFQFDQLHHVTMKSEHGVHVGHRPRLHRWTRTAARRSPRARPDGRPGHAWPESGMPRQRRGAGATPRKRCVNSPRPCANSPSGAAVAVQAGRLARRYGTCGSGGGR